MKKTTVICVAFVVLALAGCATQGAPQSVAENAPQSVAQSSRTIIPPEISQWRNDHTSDSFSGLGISTLTNTSDAYQQAVILARNDLAGSLEVEVAGIGENYVQTAEARGETERVAQFKNSTMQLIQQTISKSKTVGPYLNDREETYVLVYLDQQSARKELSQYVDDFFSDERNELKDMLGIN
jgi:hypothetical protein